MIRLSAEVIVSDNAQVGIKLPRYIDPTKLTTFYARIFREEEGRRRDENIIAGSCIFVVTVSVVEEK